MTDEIVSLQDLIDELTELESTQYEHIKEIRTNLVSSNVDITHEIHVAEAMAKRYTVLRTVIDKLFSEQTHTVEDKQITLQASKANIEARELLYDYLDMIDRSMLSDDASEELENYLDLIDSQKKQLQNQLSEACKTIKVKRP